jgi:hypothetical protein
MDDVEKRKFLTLPGLELRTLGYPALPIRTPPIVPQSSSSSSVIWGWYSRPSSGNSTKWTQFQYMRKVKKNDPSNSIVAIACAVISQALQ